MKVGDLVRYKPYPHVELHSSGMTGITLSKPYESTNPDCSERLIDVMWNKHRKPPGRLAANITWDYVDDLEVIK